MATEQPAGKLPIPRLATTAYTTKLPKKRRKTEDEKKENKRINDQRRGQSRINIGYAFSRWRALRDRLGLALDQELAVFLLDSYENPTVTSTPMKHAMTSGLPLPSASSISSDSVSEHAHDFAVAGVEELEKVAMEGVSLQQLEASMTSLDLNTGEFNYEEFNDIRNATIDWFDDPLALEDCNSDGDYEPPICIRSGGALANKIDLRQFEEIAMEDTVHDISPADIEEEEEVEERAEKLPSGDGLEYIGVPASIAYHHCLKELAEFLVLPITKCKSKDPYTSVECQSGGPFQVTVRSRASAAIIEWICPSGHIVWCWRSQPTLKYGMQVGDFMLATNILLSGNNYAKVALLFKFMNMGIVGKNTFFKIQDAYCVDTIEDFWEEKRKAIVSRLTSKPNVVVLGDGRMDSPGFSAAYCTYTVMENDSKEIIFMHTEDKRMTGRNSVIMEKEGFTASLDSLLKDLKNLKEVCTDAHPQISALFTKGKYKDSGVRHTLDMWHGSKNLGKKIHQAGQRKGCAILFSWSKDICNHFWFCAKTATTYDMFFEMWSGVLHHVTGEHEWMLGACHHGPLTDERDKAWIVKGSVAHEVLTEIVLNVRWLKEVEKFLSFRSTAELESFHNHILMYASKRFYFVWPVYRARTHLAGLDYNHHVHRPLKVNANGSLVYKKIYNKKSRQYSMYPCKEEKDYGYIPDLQRAIMSCRVSSGKGMPSKRTLRPDDPRHLGLLPPVPCPSKEELLQSQVSRGLGIHILSTRIEI